MVKENILYPMLSVCYIARYIVTSVAEYFLLHSDIFSARGTTLGMFLTGIKPDASFAQRERGIADYFDLYAPFHALITEVLFMQSCNAFLFTTLVGYTPTSLMQRSGFYARKYYAALENIFYDYFRMIGFAYPLPFKRSTSFFERFLMYGHLSSGSRFFKGKTFLF